MKPPILLNDDDLLMSGQVRATLGNISEMTLWRWQRDLGFPSPDHVINRRSFWRRGTVRRWLASRPAERRAARPSSPNIVGSAGGGEWLGTGTAP